MNRFRPMLAVILLLALLCGCAAPIDVSVTALPDVQPAAPDAAATAAPAEPADTESHLEYQTLPLPAPLLSATALTVLDDMLLVGGFTEDGLALARMPLDGEAEALPLPDGAEYLYALAPDSDSGFWLLSGSLPGAYADGHGAVHFSESTTIGKLALTRYDSAGAMQETILLQTIYAENGARFSQLRATQTGFLLLSPSLLVLLDRTGAELARQTAETDDGWRYESMTLSGGTLCVLTYNAYGASPLPELRRFSPDTLAPTDTISCETNLTGLGLAADGRLLCGSTERIDACTDDLSAAEVLVSWREQGVTNTAGQLFQTDFGFVLYAQDDTELAILRSIPGPAPERTVLSLAIAAGDAVMPYFTTMIEDFNRSQDKFRVDYEIYSDSEYNAYTPADRLRTQIGAGQAPDLYAFCTAGYNAVPLTAEDVGADLLPLLGSEFTADSLLPNLYDLLTGDGTLCQLPLTVEVDTLIGPASLFPEPGVTLADLEDARQRMPEGWVPLDSWNTPGNLFALCAAYCIGACVDKAAGTCDFETQDFYDYLAWCRGWGGDGSTPDAQERTLVTLSWTNSIGQLAGRSNAAVEYWFGEPDYTYIGFPTADGSVGSGYRIRSALAVSPQCTASDGAKAFLTFCFSYSQDDALPANAALLRSEIGEYLAGNRTNWHGEVLELSQKDADQFCALLDETTVLEGLDPALEQILSEEAAVYFAGGCTAEQAAAAIQSRASLYLKEQSD